MTPTWIEPAEPTAECRECKCRHASAKKCHLIINPKLAWQVPGGCLVRRLAAEHKAQGVTDAA